MRHFLYNLKYGIKNLFKYFKVIWNDRHWDYSFILILLKFKLETIKNSYSKKHYSTDVPYQLKYINICIILLDRLIENNLLEEELNNLYEGKEFLEFDENNIPKINDIWNRQSIIRKKHMKLLMKILESRIETWWD